VLFAVLVAMLVGIKNMGTGSPKVGRIIYSEGLLAGYPVARPADCLRIISLEEFRVSKIQDVADSLKALYKDEVKNAFRSALQDTTNIKCEAGM